MAWNLHWQCCFQSAKQIQYAVNIYDWNYSGSVSQLVGATNPFETQEAETDDIFTPVRYQTGYFRVIDNTVNGDLLVSLIPQNNTQRLIRLVTGQWVNNAFVPDETESIKWQGFLCAEAYTQPWDKNTKVLEFPIKSLLAALEDVQITESALNNNERIAHVLVNAFDSLNVHPRRFIHISNLETPQTAFFKVLISTSVFFTEESVNNQGDTYTQLVGQSYLSILEGIASLYGLCFREVNDCVCMTLYDKNGGRIFKSEYTWSNLSSLANGNSVTSTPTELPTWNMIKNLTFFGTDNIAGYVPGGRSARVTLPVDGGISLSINLPQTTEDTSTIYQIDHVRNGDVFIQPHEPRSNSIETFSYYHYTGFSTLEGTSNYNACLAYSIIWMPLYDPQSYPIARLETGAFPIRWYYRQSASDTPTMRNGILLQQRSQSGSSSFSLNYCYSIKSSFPFTLQNGYININFICNNFMRGYMAGDTNNLYFGDYNTIWSTKPQTTLWCILTVGNYEWDGTQWTVHSGEYTPFEILFDGTRIKSNKTSEMAVDASDGWFIPVSSQMTGSVTFYILNVGRTEDEATTTKTYARIITDLSVTFLPNIDLAVSRRSQNTYRQTILESGFKDDKSIDLTIGTINNNVESDRFIKSNSTTMIEQLSYYTAGSTELMRPELHLLARMSAYYNQVRRTYNAIINNNLDIVNLRYLYDSRYYFGIEFNHNWREDKRTIKFIEVT